MTKRKYTEVGQQKYIKIFNKPLKNNRSQFIASLT